MGLEILTLNLTIIAPDDTILIFNKSRRVRRSPEVVNLKPNEDF